MSHEDSCQWVTVHSSKAEKANAYRRICSIAGCSEERFEDRDTRTEIKLIDVDSDYNDKPTDYKLMCGISGQIDQIRHGKGRGL